MNGRQVSMIVNLNFPVDSCGPISPDQSVISFMRFFGRDSLVAKDEFDFLKVILYLITTLAACESVLSCLIAIFALRAL